MNRKRYSRLTLFIGLLISLLVSCNVSKSAASSSLAKTEAEESPRILFLDYQLKRYESDSIIHASLLNLILVEGSIKEKRNDPVKPMEGDLELKVLDGKGQALSWRHIPNPLDRSVEYVNDSGHLEHKLIHLDSAQFSIRIQMETGAGSILLEYFMGENKAGKLLLNTPLE